MSLYRAAILLLEVQEALSELLKGDVLEREIKRTSKGSPWSLRGRGLKSALREVIRRTDWWGCGP